jgi:hypothetical protein
VTLVALATGACQRPRLEHRAGNLDCFAKRGLEEGPGGQAAQGTYVTQPPAAPLPEVFPGRFPATLRQRVIYGYSSSNEGPVTRPDFRSGPFFFPVLSPDDPFLSMR